MKEFATVIETLPNSLYRVQTDEGRELICYLSGKMKLNQIKCIVGDTVEVVVDPFGGKTTNRIVSRK